MWRLVIEKGVLVKSVFGTENKAGPAILNLSNIDFNKLSLHVCSFECHETLYTVYMFWWSLLALSCTLSLVI